MEQAGGTKATGRKIVLTAVGSLGDLHPYLAIGQELLRRGHRAVVATVPMFRERVEAAGLEFAPVRAATAEAIDPELIRRVFHGRKGVEYILRELILPALPRAYADTTLAVEGADLLVAHPLTWATKLVAEKRGIPWVSTVLAPVSLLSVIDPPRLPGLELLQRLVRLNLLSSGRRVWRLAFGLAERISRRWLRPYDELRRSLGLADGGHPMFGGGHAPGLELALFSPLFAAPQPDWPAQTLATGFAFFEQPFEPTPYLDRWLAAGSPPVIFTLGSSAVNTPGDFFRESAFAARRIGRRALLLGASPGEVPVRPGQDLFFLPYGSYAAIFPRGAAVVHQGGVGTTAEVLRAGVPMLVVPFGVDQPDNAARVVRLGVGRTLARRRYRKRLVARELRALLEKPGYAREASEVGEAIRAERGAAMACDALEAHLGIFGVTASGARDGVSGRGGPVAVPDQLR